MFDLKPVWAGPAPPHSSHHTWSHSDHWSQHSAHLSPPASTLCWYMRYLRELFPTLDWLSLSCDMLTVLLLTSLLIVPGRADHSVGLIMAAQVPGPGHQTCAAQPSSINSLHCHHHYPGDWLQCRAVMPCFLPRLTINYYFPTFRPELQMTLTSMIVVWLQPQFWSRNTEICEED